MNRFRSGRFNLRFSASTRLTAIASLACSIASLAQTAPPPAAPWLFAGFKGNGEDGVYYALSRDGLHWTLANGGKPVVPKTEAGELMRDPFLQRGPDGRFVMVWTWGWHSQTIGYSSSSDLVHWAPHQQLAVMAAEPRARNTWAPAIYWEQNQKRWLIFWSSTISGRFPGDDAGDGGLNHRIWSTTTTDFATLTPSRIYFDPGFSVIDATLVATPKTDAPYHLVFKDERLKPLEKHLQTATGQTMEGSWTNVSLPFSEVWSEGAAVIPSQGGYLAYYDHYQSPQHYGAAFTNDFKSWTDMGAKIDFPSGLRHGSFVQLTQAEYDVLAKLQ